ncbi:MAG: Na+/H+ antiporter NhaC [Paraclostridium sp.]
MQNDKTIIRFKDSLIVFLSIITTLVLGVGILKIDLHVVLLISLFITITYTLFKGYTWEKIKTGMRLSITRAYDAMLLFILIGATIGVWMLSGTIPSLIYYGLDILSPSIFLPAGLILCSLTSMATGTSWGTVSTVGIALIGIGDSLGIPSPLTAGMIVSGAFFGDKVSPMSDTTNLAAASTDTNLYDHIGSMLYTTIPSYILALIIYTIIGFKYANNNIDYSQVMLIQDTLSSNFNISIITLIPMITVIILSILRKPAIISMAMGVITGVLVAIVLQDNDITIALMTINGGYNTPTGIEIVDKLILRGGIQSMMSTFSLAFIALSLGGVLDEIGYLKVLVEKIINKINSVGRLVLITISSCVLSNAIMGEAYLSLILNANLYKEVYKDKNLKSSMLSRTLEEGATLTTGLIPWTTAGAFISATLGINSLQYAPFAFFNLLNPIISIGFAYLGIFVIRNFKYINDV